MKFIIKDPLGFEHVLELAGQWWGAENIAHMYPPQFRGEITKELLSAIQKHKHGVWNGYSYDIQEQ